MKMPHLVGVAAGKALVLLLHSLTAGELSSCLGMGLAIISSHLRTLIQELKLAPDLRHPRGAGGYDPGSTEPQGCPLGLAAGGQTGPVG